MTEIYFDNSATTRVSKKAADAAYQAMTCDYGNPSSVHSRGVAAFHELNNARGLFARLLDAEAEEIYFTSCGTESDNIFINGAARKNRRGKILISAVEHPAVWEAAKALSALGHTVEIIPVDTQGIISLDALDTMMDNNVAAVSIMHVNNETAAVQPLKDAGKIIKSHCPEALFHIDAVQSFGRLPLALASWQADAVSISGHKIHAPKGIGALWLKKDANLPPLMVGGGQERGFRSGTENMSGILAFAAAAQDCYADMAGHYSHMAKVRAVLLNGIQQVFPQAVVNGPQGDDAAAYILNVSFPGLRSEVLLHSLEEHGLLVSAGSACTSKSSKGSRILTAMALPADIIDSAIRFSFSRFNTQEEAEQAVHIIKEVIDELSLVMRPGKKKNRR